MINRDYETIYEALKKNKLAFFIGSGFSKAECADYPLWNDVLEKLKLDVAEGNKKDMLYKETDALKIAQFHRLKFGKGTTKKITKNVFPKVAVPGELTKRLLNLYPHCIVTTNWDRFFDNAVNNNAYIYDVIAADYELVESENNSKIIKMHGDFEHDNYVFTEDDYLNYRKNFPLIENYVKSIISTHVVIFLGYSFNDIDMKQIFNWFREKSTLQPAAYMVQVGANEVLKSYLKNFGITVLDIDKGCSPTGNDYLDAISGLIENIENYEEDKYAENAFDYVFNKLNRFEKYPMVLQSQIVSDLGNCTINFSTYKESYLQFYDKLLTRDFDRKKRDVYKRFVNLLNDREWLQENEQKYNILKNIFLKCRIRGVVYSDLLDGPPIIHAFEGEWKNGDVEEFKSFHFTLEYDLIDIKTKMKHVYCLYNLRKYDEAYEENERIIEQCKREKVWYSLFIAIFNQKVLSACCSLEGSIKKTDRSKKEWSLDDLYQRLPFETQKECSEIYLFLKDGGLFAEYAKAQSKLDEINKRIEKEKNGTIYFSNDKPINPIVLENLIHYILANYICIDLFKDCKDICRKYLECDILTQRKSNVIHLSKNETYACVKFLEEDVIKQLIKNTNGIMRVFELDEDCVKWLIDVAINCCKMKPLYAYFENALFILSMTRINKNDYNNFIDRIMIDLENSITNHCQIDLSSLVEFLFLQKKLFKNSPKKIIGSLVEKILLFLSQGLITQRNECYLRGGPAVWLFSLYDKSKCSFGNVDLLKGLVAKLKRLPLIEQLGYRMTLLCPLYLCSNQVCKRIIKASIHYESEKNVGLGTAESIVTFNYLLSLQEVGLKKKSKLLTSQLKKIINKYPSDTYSGHFVTASYKLKGLSKNNSDYKKLKKKIDGWIKSFDGFGAFATS